MRLIKADALRTVFTEKSTENVCGAKLCKAIISRIDEIPTVDAVPVIRCKDCKHASLTYDSRAKYCRYWDERYDDSTKLYLDSDFYCAAAERKEE